MMTDDKNLAGELLKKNGLNPGEAPDQTLRQIRQILDRELKRAGKLKRACTIVWLITAVWPVVSVMLRILSEITVPAWRNINLGVQDYLILGWYVLVPCAIALTVITHLSIRTATVYQTQASLTSISEQLKHRSAESSTD